MKPDVSSYTERSQAELDHYGFLVGANNSTIPIGTVMQIQDRTDYSLDTLTVVVIGTATREEFQEHIKQFHNCDLSQYAHFPFYFKAKAE
jgi:hypothetical protein